MTKKYYMGIDGGGTKTKFIIADETGKIRASYTGGPCHYLQVGYDGLEKLMRAGRASVIDAFNEDPENANCVPIGPEDITRCCAGCAGYDDVKADDPLIREAVQRGLGEIPLTLVNDCVIALFGALGGAEGICMIAGTGSVAYGYSKKAGFVRSGGWHHILGGDEGSGYWIGWSMLKEFGRQSDGRTEKTLLHERIREELGLRTDDELVTRVAEEWELDRTKIAALAPVLTELYDAGDPYAKKLTEKTAEELAAMAIALYRRSGFSKEKDGPVPVSGAGSIFRMEERLKGPLTEKLEANGMEWREPAGSPEEGAILLAMREG